MSVRSSSNAAWFLERTERPTPCPRRLSQSLTHTLGGGECDDGGSGAAGAGAGAGDGGGGGTYVDGKTNPAHAESAGSVSSMN